MTKQVPAYTPVVGTLSEWYVENGAAVAEGEIICMVESMKTMFPVYAPAAGTLRTRYNLGQVTAEDDPVAMIEVSDG